jgi:hypothetical protein
MPNKAGAVADARDNIKRGPLDGGWSLPVSNCRPDPGLLGMNRLLYRNHIIIVGHLVARRDR